MSSPIWTYPQLTQAAQAEIQRLIAKAQERERFNEDGFIYRQWAYGVYLGWKAATQGQQLPGDQMHLEALATDEHQF